MKKKTLILAITIALFGVFSCENDAGEDCKDCRTQKILSDGTVVDEGIEETFCLEELEEIQSSEPIEIEGVRTIWICR